MSRETDSSSSGPRGRGGSAHTPGTEPYGSADGTSEETPPGTGPDSGDEADEPKTETTLTTRIRINIPGSRPIPPVVMRKPVGGKDGSEEGERAEDHATSSGTAATSAVADGGVSAGADVGGRDRADRTAAMSADRSNGPRGARDSGGAADSGLPAGAGPGPVGASSDSPGAGQPTGTGGSGSGSGSGGTAGSGEGEFSRGTSDWFAPRKRPKRVPQSDAGSSAPATPPPPRGSDDEVSGGSPYATDPSPDAGLAGPGQLGTAGLGGVPGAPGASGSGSDHPDTPPDGFPAVGTGGGAGPGPSHGPVDGPMGPFQDGPGGAGAPSGPTSGPATGDMPLGPPGAQTPPLPPFGMGPPVAAEQSPDSSASALYESGAHPVQPPPPGPGAGPAPGAVAPPDAAPNDPPSSSETLVSGIPRLPSSESERAATGTPPDPSTEPPAPPAGERRDLDAGTTPPTSKGRSKLVMVGAGLVAVLGVAYGIGLLLDHADVPNGTTVLGVDIGGKQQQDAVNTLDKALGDRTTEPMTVKVGGEKEELKPSVAGLTVNTEETVRNASGQDYNPVSVIGSLLGGSRDADAAVEVDEDKLKAALSSLPISKGAGSGEGMVKFEDGKAVGVPGRPHKALDIGKAVDTVKEAYRERAATGTNSAVALPVSTQQPKISKKEVQEAVDGFGKKAMSGWVWLKAGDVEVPFSEDTIGKFLTMEEGGGKLQPVVDPVALEKVYGSAFDDVVIEGGAGTVPMNSRHAASAMSLALRKAAPPEPEKRMAVVQNARSR